jgi:multisubunit Na+/H+ antiporter MnhB subunit
MQKPYTSKDKWIVSIVVGLLFLIIASPFLFSFVNSITEYAGFETSNDGKPNVFGLLIQSAIFIIIIRIFMK